MSTEELYDRAHKDDAFLKEKIEEYQDQKRLALLSGTFMGACWLAYAVYSLVAYDRLIGADSLLGLAIAVMVYGHARERQSALHALAKNKPNKAPEPTRCARGSSQDVSQEK